MPNLSHEAAAEYWHGYADPMIYRVVTFMESVEEWTLDGNPEFELAMKNLGAKLDEVQALDMNKLNEAEKFIRLVGNIKSGRGLRLLQILDTAHPGSASKILIHAEETSTHPQDPASFFLKRNIVFERLRLLSRAFSEYRLNLVSRAMEGEE